MVVGEVVGNGDGRREVRFTADQVSEGEVFTQEKLYVGEVNGCNEVETVLGRRVKQKEATDTSLDLLDC